MSFFSTIYFRFSSKKQKKVHHRLKFFLIHFVALASENVIRLHSIYLVFFTNIKAKIFWNFYYNLRFFVNRIIREFWLQYIEWLRNIYLFIFFFALAFVGKNSLTQPIWIEIFLSVKIRIMLESNWSYFPA